MLPQLEITTPPAHLAEQVPRRIDEKTKPPGSLGRIEQLAVAMAMAQHSAAPRVERARLLLFAGDHGLVAEGVSAWPQSVTAQMVGNFLAGGAAANAFAEACGAELSVIDAGVAVELPAHRGLIAAAVARGTRNARLEDAMSAVQCEQALQCGATVAGQACEEGASVLLLGEMGIGNTSSATLLAHALMSAPLAQLVGPGAGLQADGIRHKLAVLEACVARRGKVDSGVDALRAFGGFEVAMMAGAIVAAAHHRAAVVIDGFIASAAALVVQADRPEALAHCIFAHRSAEPGHDAVLAALAATPLLDLEMRLGEGTGALLALPLLRAACGMLNDMASFDSAGVDSRT
ncbi:MAG: nicotinate-nucleotide--dimethylbenzimidazole phosphoribosyltransferase [Gammaproteobacteria bacterium]|nr:nicotinate-nucleotide--dimethylbenzimidazole phosphoribosyltransferase [Gammaproteobacteria bacterium]